MSIPNDLEIARRCKPAPISTIAEKLSIPSQHLISYGHDKAKVDLDALLKDDKREPGKLILVTAVSPTPAGEGKTTTSVGLGDALSRIGKKVSICLREPSLGPCFGIKGGAAGGGYSQVVPMESINLHFTGDFHAITSAHNLLSAMLDNHVYWGNSLNLDLRYVQWPRVVDLSDRALRNITIGQGGAANGFLRSERFDITVASEIMAIFCLSKDHQELKENLDRIYIGMDRNKKMVFAEQLEATGSMQVLLKEALQPNLAQTLEQTPAFVHGGPFANIAHGCNSVRATNAALALSDYVVTEAGFAAELGAEKFFDIKCRKANLKPAASVLVATIRSLRVQGGGDLNQKDNAALSRGLDNLKRHADNLMNQFGLPVCVAINAFSQDSKDEMQLVSDCCSDLGIKAFSCENWAKGGEGAIELAEAVVQACDSPSSNFKLLYEDKLSLNDKIRTICTRLYGAADVQFSPQAIKSLDEFTENGFGHLPVCMAKTQYSFSADPRLMGAPSGHTVPVQEVRLSSGAGFVIVICGKIMTMPGLPRVPAATRIFVDKQGQTQGLF